MLKSALPGRLRRVLASLSAVFLIQMGAGAGVASAADVPMPPAALRDKAPGDIAAVREVSTRESETSAPSPVLETPAATEPERPEVVPAAPAESADPQVSSEPKAANKPRTSASAANKPRASAATPNKPRASAPAAKLDCVANAMQLAEPLLTSLTIPGSARNRGVYSLLAEIKRQSGACADKLFADGTAARPDAGLLSGNGFSYTAETCTEAEVCEGGNAGALLGNGGNGFNGGRGGDAGWYAGTAGNGGDAAAAACTEETCVGGDGGRAGRYGRGGQGGDGAPGFDGGDGGTGGLIGGAGGNGGDGGDATAVGQAGGNGGAGGAAGLSANATNGGNGGDGGIYFGKGGQGGAGSNGGSAGANGQNDPGP